MEENRPRKERMEEMSKTFIYRGEFTVHLEFATVNSKCCGRELMVVMVKACMLFSGSSRYFLTLIP